MLLSLWADRSRALAHPPKGTSRCLVFLVKKARRAATEIKKFEKRDLAQVVINAAYLVAYADGECEAS